MRFSDTTFILRFPLYTRVAIKGSDKNGVIDAYANGRYRIRLDGGTFTWEFEYDLLPVQDGKKLNL